MPWRAHIFQNHAYYIQLLPVIVNLQIMLQFRARHISQTLFLVYFPFFPQKDRLSYNDINRQQRTENIRAINLNDSQGLELLPLSAGEYNQQGLCSMELTSVFHLKRINTQ